MMKLERAGRNCWGMFSEYKEGGILVLHVNDAIQAREGDGAEKLGEKQ